MSHYETLEVSPNASPEIIKAAYRSLMQRYHPDKNPNDPVSAERATRVIEAYSVLSDPVLRSTYNSTLQKSTAPSHHRLQETHRTRPSHATATIKKDTSYALIGMVSAVIVMCSWFIFSPTQPVLTPVVELQKIRASLASRTITSEQQQKLHEREAEILNAHPDINRQESRDKADEIEARTVAIMTAQLTVTLVPPAPASGVTEITTENTEHVLVIPLLLGQVGTFDSAKVIHHLEANQALIRQNIAEKLAHAQYSELTKIDAEHYLKELILDSIDETTGTNRHEKYPASPTESPGRYGVIGVTLPEPFSIR